MDLSNVPQSLNAVTAELASENDRKSVVTLIQDLAFALEEAAKYVTHDRLCATWVGPQGPYGWERGCDCGLDKLAVQIEEVLQRAKEARHG